MHIHTFAEHCRIIAIMMALTKHVKLHDQA
jgi:hypothetical protein